MRLDKFVCKSTELTKVDATQCINSGKVRVNDEVITNEATQIHENNTIYLDAQELKARAFRYILMHKPSGTICSNVDEIYPSLFNYLNVDRLSELHIVGRLDADTTGLILITDDGRWSFNITAPKKDCSKVYRVVLSKDLGDGVTAIFKKGLYLQGEQHLTLPAHLEVLNKREVLLSLTEGKFHQVKRMFAAVGNRVRSLHREKVGDICLDVGLGEWRYLTDNEVRSFTK